MLGPATDISMYSSDLSSVPPNVYSQPLTSSLYPSNAPRSRSPRSDRTYTGQVLRKLQLPRSVRARRVLSHILLWTCVLYLIHRLLLPFSPLLWASKRPAADEHFLSTSFPIPPTREGDDTLDSLDPLYRPFSPLDPPEAPFPRLRPTRFLPPDCLEQWFADGETSCGAQELGSEETLDATWLWVNGSDPRWKRSMVRALHAEGVYSPEHHFR